MGDAPHWGGLVAEDKKVATASRDRALKKKKTEEKKG